MSISIKDDELVPSPTRGFAWTLIITGLVGWLASLILTIEEINHFKNVGQALSCDLNPLFNCTTVMVSKYGSLLGFPNPLLGLGAFVAPMAVGLGILAGARFKLWFWRLFIFGCFAGMGFVVWLFIATTFLIGALCPYCMLAWVAMIPLFWKVVLWACKVDIIEVPKRMIGFFDRAYDWSLLFSIGTEFIFALIILIRLWGTIERLFL